MKIKIIGIITLLIISLTSTAWTHCQVPCGIYDDHARVDALTEDMNTIRKAVTKIEELANKNDPQSKNQLIRWVQNKEKHAQNIISTIADYFLTQRVKPKQKDYLDRLKNQTRFSLIVNSKASLF